MARDPVCGMYVDENKSSFKYEIDAITYYFCSKGCLISFIRPEVTYKRIKYLTIVSFLFGIAIAILEFFVKLSFFFPIEFWLLILSIPVQFGAGYYFYVGFKDAIMTKQANMDTLIAIGTTTSWLYSTISVLQKLNLIPNFIPENSLGIYYMESSLIIAFILLGKLIEHNVKRKASKAVRKLTEMIPKKARKLENNHENEVNIDELKAGDIVIVKPGEIIPVDGIVIEGYSSVDQSNLTGESIPVEKKIGDFVYASTINKNGYIKIKAIKTGKETAIANVGKLIEKAIQSRAPIQKIADKISSYFVPTVVAVAIFSFIFWYFFAKLPLNYAIVPLIAVLIIACPCALGLATPAALMIAAGKSAQKGILVKGGEYLEKARKINTIVFDKTKTLTKGIIKVQEILVFDNFNEIEVLKFAAIAEKYSEHPFSQAIIQEARNKGIEIPNPNHFEYIPGMGIRAVFENHEILIGNESLMHEYGIDTSFVKEKIRQLGNEGYTVLILAVNKKLSAIFSLADEIKDEAKEVIEYLNRKGFEVIMITGDNERIASAIARKLGIKRYYAEVLPEKKAEIIENLKKEGKIVAMVGDGINDAVALTVADLGIAMGSGTDIAKEAGGIILLNNDLRNVIYALEISRKTYSKIKQNLFWAFFYNTILIPIAAGALFPLYGIFLNPIFAAIAMASSSISVVINSMSLSRL